MGPEFVEPTILPVPARVLEVKIKPKTRSMHRFDIEVEGTHNYLADGVVVHNSPETTTGGKALKFYASVRIDVRRIETLKDGGDAIGHRPRAKIVKHTAAPPVKLAALDIVDGFGQRSKLDFSAVVSNPSLAADRFRFVLPAGADLIEQ